MDPNKLNSVTTARLDEISQQIKKSIVFLTQLSEPFQFSQPVEEVVEPILNSVSIPKFSFAEPFKKPKVEDNSIVDELINCIASLNIDGSEYESTTELKFPVKSTEEIVSTELENSETVPWIVLKNSSGEVVPNDDKGNIEIISEESTVPWNCFIKTSDSVKDSENVQNITSRPDNSDTVPWFLQIKKSDSMVSTDDNENILLEESTVPWICYDDNVTPTFGNNTHMSSFQMDCFEEPYEIDANDQALSVRYDLIEVGADNNEPANEVDSNMENSRNNLLVAKEETNKDDNDQNVHSNFESGFDNAVKKIGDECEDAEHSKNEDEGKCTETPGKTDDSEKDTEFRPNDRTDDCNKSNEKASSEENVQATPDEKSKGSSDQIECNEEQDVQMDCSKVQDVDYKLVSNNSSENDQTSGVTLNFSVQQGQGASRNELLRNNPDPNIHIANATTPYVIRNDNCRTDANASGNIDSNTPTKHLEGDHRSIKLNVDGGTLQNDVNENIPLSNTPIANCETQDVDAETPNSPTHACRSGDIDPNTQITHLEVDSHVRPPQKVYDNQPLPFLIEHIHKITWSNQEEVAFAPIMQLFGQTFKSVMVYGTVTSIIVEQGGLTQRFVIDDGSGSINVVWKASKQILELLKTVHHLNEEVKLCRKSGLSVMNENWRPNSKECKKMLDSFDKILHYIKRHVTERTKLKLFGYAAVVGKPFRSKDKSVVQLHATLIEDNSHDRSLELYFKKNLIRLYEEKYMPNS